MKEKCLLIFVLSMLSLNTFCQVGISEAEFLPDEAAMLDVKGGSTADPRGVLVPRFNAAQETNILVKVNAPAVPTADGLLYYSTTRKQFMFYNAALKTFLGVSPWTPLPDFNTIHFAGRVGIGTNAPGAGYKLDVQGGDVRILEGLNVGQGLEVGAAANLAQELNVTGKTTLKGDVTMGDNANDNIEVQGTLTATSGVVVPPSQNYTYSAPRTRYYTATGADFEALRFFNNGSSQDKANVTVTQFSVWNRNTSTDKVFAFTTLHLPQGARIIDAKVRFNISGAATVPLDVRIRRQSVNGGGSLSVGEYTSNEQGSVTVTMPMLQEVIIDNVNYVYILQITIPNNASNAGTAIVQYEIDQAD